jgi:hypothetical protein
MPNKIVAHPVIEKLSIAFDRCTDPQMKKIWQNKIKDQERKLVDLDKIKRRPVDHRKEEGADCE